jgi:hypothetical protein
VAGAAVILTVLWVTIAEQRKAIAARERRQKQDAIAQSLSHSERETIRRRMDSLQVPAEPPPEPHIVSPSAMLMLRIHNMLDAMTLPEVLAAFAVDGHVKPERAEKLCEELLALGRFGGRDAIASRIAFEIANPTKTSQEKEEQQKEREHQRQNALQQKRRELANQIANEYGIHIQHVFGVAEQSQSTPLAREGVGSSSVGADSCPVCRVPLKPWEGKLRCWICGWQEKR